MSVNSAFYHARADDCAREAEAAILDNVRDRCLRSEAAWRALAKRLANVEKLSAKLAAAKAERK